MALTNNQIKQVVSVLKNSLRNKFKNYNPYEPKPYSRWTMAGMLDLKQELKVAEEFWDFLGGEGTYMQLLDIFESVGIELGPEIDQYFNKFNNQTL
jgi:type II restriction enzyme